MSTTSPLDVLEAAAAAAGAVGTLGVAAWWLVAPRVRAYVDGVLAPVVDALAGRLDDHHQRLERLELGQRQTHDPDHLLDLAELLTTVRQHRPPPKDWGDDE